MNVSKLLLLINFLMLPLFVCASLKDMHSLVVAATQGQNLAANSLSLPYKQPGKTIAAGIRERADSILAAGERTAADATACAAKLASAEKRADDATRRATTAEARARAAATAPARPLPPTEDPRVKAENARLTAELERMRTEAADKDAQILELTKQLRERDEKTKSAIANLAKALG